MISIIDHIEYLITEYDCVIIPGWGALIAQYDHAYINRNIFIPPRRILSFNSSVNHNDGLLANSIVRRDRVNYETALSCINDEVNSLKLQLRNGSDVAIGRIGFFMLNEEGAICFEPFINGYDRNDFFGLSSLTVIPLSEMTKVEVEEIDVSKKKKDVVYVPISRNIFKIAASIVLLIGLSVVLSTPVIVEKGHDFASLNPLTPENIVKDATPASLHDASGELVISLPRETSAENKMIVNSGAEIKEVIQERDIVVKTEKSADIFTSDENDDYFLIVASLQTRNLAEKHIARYNVPSMGILEKDGKYRIYIASSHNKNSLSKISDRLKSEFPGSWVCSR